MYLCCDLTKNILRNLYRKETTIFSLYHQICIFCPILNRDDPHFQNVLENLSVEYLYVVDRQLEDVVINLGSYIPMFLIRGKMTKLTCCALYTSEIPSHPVLNHIIFI